MYYVGYFVLLIMMTILWIFALMTLFQANIHIKNRFFELEITTERIDDGNNIK